MSLSKLAAESSFKTKIREAGFVFNPPADAESDDCDVRDIVEAELNRTCLPFSWPSRVGRSHQATDRRKTDPLIVTHSRLKLLRNDRSSNNRTAKHCHEDPGDPTMNINDHHG